MKDKAARNMINRLYECGYIDDSSKAKLEERLKLGDLGVFEELRVFLIGLIEKTAK